MIMSLPLTKVFGIKMSTNRILTLYILTKHKGTGTQKNWKENSPFVQMVSLQSSFFLNACHENNHSLSDKARVTVIRSYKVEDFVWTHPTTRVNNQLQKICTLRPTRMPNIFMIIQSINSRSDFCRSIICRTTSQRPRGTGSITLGPSSIHKKHLSHEINFLVALSGGSHWANPSLVCVLSLPQSNSNLLNKIIKQLREPFIQSLGVGAKWKVRSSWWPLRRS